MNEESTGIKCPKCHCRHCPENRHRVAQTFATGQGQYIFRQRVCRNCGHRFTTKEFTTAHLADQDPPATF